MKTDADFRAFVKEYLKEYLSLNHNETSEYNGGFNGEMYTKYNVVELVIDGEVISEISFTTKE